MSYRRAWLLVDAMNRCFARPLVATSPGRAAQGSARLTPDGVTVLSHYRNLQVMALSLNESAAWGELAAMIRPAPCPDKGPMDDPTGRSLTHLAPNPRCRERFALVRERCRSSNRCLALSAHGCRARCAG
jgi:hypothetical protein